MTRDELMERMSGHEFTAWIALNNVRAQEAADAADPEDGKVFFHGKDPDADDEEPEDDEGDGG